MNRAKKLLILAAAVILIIAVILVIIIIKNKASQNSEQNGGTPAVDIPVVPNNKTIQSVSSRNDFYVVKNIVDNYYTYIENISAGVDVNTNSGMLYSFLDDDYINAFGITTDNILDKLGKCGNVTAVINKMDVSENTKTTSTYFVYGMLIDSDANTVSDFTLMVTLDLANYTFSVAPYDYITKLGYDKLKEGDTLSRDITEIADKQYNEYEYADTSDEAVMLDYMELYSAEAIYKTDESYNLLDSAYRDKRFGSLENYKKYVQDNKDNLANITITKYSADGTEDNMQYMCIDTNENTYTINETGIMQFTIMLDNYTIKTDQFNTAYAQATDENKVATNIDIFIRMINTKDYNNAYNLLDSGFRNNYFKAESDFENYVKQNFFNNNVLTVNNVTSDAGLYQANVTLSSGNTVAADTKTWTFIMEIGQGTDFVISFTVQ